jgi:hypothetical protein
MMHQGGKGVRMHANKRVTKPKRTQLNKEICYKSVISVALKFILSYQESKKIYKSYFSVNFFPKFSTSRKLLLTFVPQRQI